jgi:hypothetical protein
MRFCTNHLEQIVEVCEKVDISSFNSDATVKDVPKKTTSKKISNSIGI